MVLVLVTSDCHEESIIIDITISNITNFNGSVQRCVAVVVAAVYVDVLVVEQQLDDGVVLVAQGPHLRESD